MVSNSAVAAEAGPQAPTLMQWVVFHCAGEPFGFPLERVVEILTPRPFTRLPGAGAEVCGLVGAGGRVVTVVDIGVLLGLRPAAADPDHRLLLLGIGERRIGAAVEHVAAVTPARLDTDTNGEADKPFRTVANAAWLGTGRAPDGGFTALDPEPLLRHLLQT